MYFGVLGPEINPEINGFPVPRKKGAKPEGKRDPQGMFTSIEDLPPKWMVQKPSETMFRICYVLPKLLPQEKHHVQFFKIMTPNSDKNM